MYFLGLFVILTSLKRQCRTKRDLRCAETLWRIISQQLPDLFGITELASSQIEILAGLDDTRFHIFSHYCNENYQGILRLIKDVGVIKCISNKMENEG